MRRSMSTARSTFANCGSEKLLDGDGKIAHPFAGGVIDRIGDGRRNADDSNLADPLRADRIYMRIFLGDKSHVDGADVSVDRHQVLREIDVRERAEPPV